MRALLARAREYVTELVTFGRPEYDAAVRVREEFDRETARIVAMRQSLEQTRDEQLPAMLSGVKEQLARAKSMAAESERQLKATLDSMPRPHLEEEAVQARVEQIRKQMAADAGLARMVGRARSKKLDAEEAPSKGKD